jgi:hypothetical protein
MVSDEFKLDEDTEAKIKEGLKHLEKFADRPFEERAKILTKFLEELGITVERDETFGDVLVATPEGWGVMVLFNKDARIKEGDVVWE